MANFTKIFFLTILICSLQTLCPLRTSAQLVSDFRVNDDTTSTEQFSARLGVDSLGIITSVWRDQRNNNPNIYCQRFNSNGVFIGQNFRVNINPDSSGSPAVAVAKNGMFGVCWVEINGAINNSSKVKFRLYDNLALPVTGEIIINDTNGNFTGRPSSIGVSPLNEFTITWEQNNILFQRLDSLGNKIGSNTKVNDDTGNNMHENPAITVRQDGSFIITWNDTRPPATFNADDIYMQMYDKFGNRIGVNQRVNDDLVSANQQRYPHISSDTSGNFVIAWQDNRLYFINDEVYSQLFNSSGIKNGVNFRVSQSSVDYGKGICNVVKKPQGDFLVGWSEARPNVSKCYFQRYTNSGIRIGNDYLVTTESPSTIKYYSDVTIFEDRIISVWTDARNGPFDIYCNIRSFTNPDTTVNIIQISENIPEKFSLSQNYPNPFNPATNIRFSISKAGYVSIIIYDVLGKEIQRLVSENLNPGFYKADFSGSNLPSGVYFYRISSKDFSAIKKMTLLK